MSAHSVCLMVKLLNRQNHCLMNNYQYLSKKTLLKGGILPKKYFHIQKSSVKIHETLKGVFCCVN